MPCDILNMSYYRQKEELIFKNEESFGCNGQNVGGRTEVIYLKTTKKEVLKFLIPSVVGVVLFLLPVKYNNGWTIPSGILVELMLSALEGWLPTISTIAVIISAVVAAIHKIRPIAYVSKHKTLMQYFETSWAWIVIRTLGMIFAILTLTGIGPEWIISMDICGSLLYDLLPQAFCWFFVSGILMPLLLDYGAMELIGTLFRGVVKPLFLIPGRAAIDCLASWIGSGSVGVVVTKVQYDEGCYTAKEAAIIMTNFSVLSIGFALTIANYMNIGNLFLPFYASVCFVGMICAVIIPRIYPIRKLPETYNPKTGKRVSEEAPSGYGKLRWGYELAINKAKAANGFVDMVKKGIALAFDIIINTSPVVVGIGTVALIVVHYTPFFQIISLPFEYLLNVLNVPFAEEAAPTMLVGFVDMFLPAVLGNAIPSELTRFLVAGISFTQLIYMTEVGSIMLKSDVPLGIKELVLIFLERTIIIIPMFVLIGRFVLGLS